MAGKKRRGRKAARANSRRSRRVPKFEGVCGKCGRDEFENKFSFAQHKRFCKGRKTGVIAPIPEGRQAFSGPSLVQTMLKQGQEGAGTADRLKAEAAALRKRSDEILEYVKSFEAGAAKFLAK